jgi:hypothetical protein
VWHGCAILREMKDRTVGSKQIARWINERGLQDIVAFLLDVGRPFGIFAAQAAYLIEPIFGSHQGLLRDLAAFLEDPDQVEGLIKQLGKDVEDHG